MEEQLKMFEVEKQVLENVILKKDEQIKQLSIT